YYADGLGPGGHTLAVVNAEGGEVLSLDYARVLQPRPSVVVSPHPATGNTAPTMHPAVMAGIIGGVAAFVILAVAIGCYWIWMRRRGQYKPVNACDPRNGLFTVPPIGYAPTAAGPGLADRTMRSHRVLYTGFPREKTAR
ncbi:hypothetical protein FRC11_001543, partial [Ceratobasidium sp. 423]